LMLSATLESCARERLLFPERNARDWDAADTPDPATAALEAYPLICMRDADTVHRLHRLRDDDPSSPIDKHITPTLEPTITDPETTAAAIARQVNDGARVLVIRNTVRGAIELFHAMIAHGLGAENMLSIDGRPTVHHSRYAAPDRERLDSQILAMLGKRTRHPHGCVVIATQTAEQSLDIDADVLWTDLAPMDVLLQRAGRLHRHADRPADGSAGGRDPRWHDPHLHVLTPADDDLKAYLGKQPQRHGLGPRPDTADGVYPDLCALQLTWDALAEHDVLVIPRDNRRLIEDTLHPDRRRAVAEQRGDQWQAHWQRCFGANAAHAGLGLRNSCDWSQPFDESTPLGDETITTRLGDLPVLIPFAEPVTSPFGERIDRIAVPSWMIRDGSSLPDEPAAIHTDASGTIAITCGGLDLRYTHLGLEAVR
jgi:CRISPR-associated endonuclease/helicase Cas3